MTRVSRFVWGGLWVKFYETVDQVSTLLRERGAGVVSRAEARV